MNIKEAYEVMQAEWVRVNDVQKGDTVRILRDYNTYELGCDAGGDDNTEKQSRVVSTKNRHIGVAGFGFVPFFVLEIVDQPRDKSKMIDIKGKKWSEDTIAEALKAHAK